MKAILLFLFHYFYKKKKNSGAAACFTAFTFQCLAVKTFLIFSEYMSKLMMMTLQSLLLILLFVGDLSSTCILISTVAQPVAVFWDKVCLAHMTTCRSGFRVWVKIWLCVSVLWRALNSFRVLTLKGYLFLLIRA